MAHGSKLHNSFGFSKPERRGDSLQARVPTLNDSKEIQGNTATPSALFITSLRNPSHSIFNKFNLFLAEPILSDFHS